MVLGNTEIPDHHGLLFQVFVQAARRGLAGPMLRAISRPPLRDTALGLGPLFTDPSYMDGEFGELFLAPLRDPRVLASQVRVLAAFDPGVIDALAEVHRRIHAPTLCIWGPDDPFFPVAKARAMLAQFAGPAELVEIPGASSSSTRTTPPSSSPTPSPSSSGRWARARVPCAGLSAPEGGGGRPGEVEPPRQMIDKLDEVERRYDRLEADLANPETLGDNARLTKVMKERSSLERIVGVYRAFKSVRADLGEAERMLESSDPDERALGKEELPALRERRDALEAELKVLLIPRDPNDEKNVILEIRAGAGGDEAGLFGEEVLQMYLRYADRKGWKAELVDVSPGNAGGIKDATVTLSGEAVYSSMKYESGVHRVQRVPATEAQGRIHTSTITVAVMPEAEDVDIQINPADIEIRSCARPARGVRASTPPTRPSASSTSPPASW